MYSTKNSCPHSGRKLEQSNSSAAIIRTTFLLQEVILRDNWLAEVTREFTLNNKFLTVAITITSTHGYNESSTDICIYSLQSDPSSYCKPMDMGLVNCVVCPFTL